MSLKAVLFVGPEGAAAEPVVGQMISIVVEMLPAAGNVVAVVVAVGQSGEKQLK